MIYFSVPADFRKETIDAYVKLNGKYNDKKVADTYGNITIDNFIESGRSIDQLPSVDFIKLHEYVDYSKKNGVDFSYTINAPHFRNKEFLQKDLYDISNFLKKIYSIGIRNVIVSSPPLLEFIRSMDLYFKIKISAICQVNNANKALFYKKKGGDKIVTDDSINRDFKRLAEIRKSFGEKVEVIANSICYQDCVYKQFHYNQIAFDSIELSSESSKSFYLHRCLMHKHSNVSNMLKMNWIRPEDLHYYTEIGINHFKLQGRHLMLNSDPVRAVEFYFQENYDGNLIDLLNMFHKKKKNKMTKFNISVDNKSLDGFLDPFVRNNNFCSHSCNECNHCNKFAENAINVDSSKELAKFAEDFYSEHDQFNKIISTINGSS
jgi:collagenase-like PrtC family protease